MEILGFISMVIGFVVMFFAIYTRYKLQKISYNKIKNEIEKDTAKILEDSHKARILKKVEEFLENSKFEEIIGSWRGENIYRYIYNNGYIYEFEDIMPENKQSIGIDENNLHFKQLSYKRIENPENFLNSTKLI